MPSNTRRKKHSVPKTSAKKQGALGSVRIIAGKHRGRKLLVRDAEGLRPTTDRMKETLFNWLIGEVVGTKVLDLYAGSGSLGFESLSRGAAEVTFFELDKNNYHLIQENAKQLDAEQEVKIHHGDSFELLKKQNTQFELVFVDPPFNKNLLKSSLNALIEENSLTDGAKIYIEHEANLRLDLPNCFEIDKQKKTKSLHTALLVFHQ
ncbi:16S rRNA (guanine(966)-N(2))-methyltransferase RsmD [Agaribacter marinus]|uniref:Ribosomal RNA small subunit methyltransferase D n=1 Tax=Agaribacter marinus TaxID=1431249 RepID=A0AA37T045_9ALTE|nr:16S rRNA (guanine(966)-N(2))-methyltransferase RsmD [Agaribacter marinus]GLR72367.1 ribosomal RNA small subunit methyltransferase D [Agaribacter marinus]